MISILLFTPTKPINIGYLIGIFDSFPTCIQVSEFLMPPQGAICLRCSPYSSLNFICVVINKYCTGAINLNSSFLFSS